MGHEASRVRCSELVAISPWRRLEFAGMMVMMDGVRRRRSKGVTGSRIQNVRVAGDAYMFTAIGAKMFQ